MGEKETLCWTCQNAYANKCCWMERCHPVEGWGAQPTRIRMHLDDTEAVVRSYRVYACPNYIPDPPHARYEKALCPICHATFMRRPQNRKYCSTRCRDLARIRIL